MTAPARSTIKVLSTHAVKDVIDALGAKLDRAAGWSVSLSYDPANVLIQRIEGGEPFDAVIATRAALETLVRQNRVAADTIADLGHSGLGLSVRKGAPVPDISTVEAFKAALLAAESVVRSKDGTSGIYFATLLDRLGITELMRGKIVLGPSGRVAELVAKGDATMAVQQVSELLPVKEAHYVGPFPEALQLYTMFSAGVGTASKSRDAALAFIAALTTPAAVALFNTKGLDPAPVGK